MKKKLNNKIAILGDTHFGCRSDSLAFHSYFKKYYEWFFNELKERNIDTLVQLGDWHDRKKYSNFNSLHLCEEYFFDPMLKQGINAYFIAGNHDISFKNTNRVNSLDAYLRKFSNITVITDNVTTLKVKNIFCDFYPWINQENFSDAVAHAKDIAAKYAFGHFEFNNFELYKGHTATEGMDHRIFSKYDHVFSGHYHTHSVKDNVIYTGTPYELNWSDFNDKKYFLILDVETGEIEYVETPFTMHVKLVYDDKNNNITQPVDIAGKYVKIVVVNKENFFNFDKYLTAVNEAEPVEVKIIEENIKEMIETVEEESLCFDDTPTLMETYVNSIEDLTDDKKLKLQSIMKQLYLEASNT